MTLCRKCGKEIPDEVELCEECQSLKQQSGEEYFDELMQSMAEQKQESSVGEPVAELLSGKENLFTGKEKEENAGNEEDINELLALLSQDYDEDDSQEDVFVPADSEETDFEKNEDFDAPLEPVLFSGEDSEEDVFAENFETLGVDDVYDDALSAIAYSEAEEEQLETDEVLDEFVLPEENESDSADDIVLDELLHDEEDKPEILEKQSVIEKKDSIWKRVFGNVVTEQTAEEEAKQREAEQEEAEAKAREKEKKKQRLATAKEEKARAVQTAKEQKAEKKAEQTALKEAKKAEKMRLKAEQETAEVIGKINPVGASLVVLLFAVLCVITLVGTQVISYSASINNAERSFEQRDYRGAYESLSGIGVSEDSEELKDKIRICMQLQHQLDAYDNYYEMGMYLEALDSLMKGIRSYDTNISKAEQYDVMEQFSELEVKLVKQLQDEFGVTTIQARSINGILEQEEYTGRLETIIERWEQRNQEDER